MRKSIRHLGRQELGATALEYAVIAGILVVGLILVFTDLTAGITTLFDNIMTDLGINS